jgi:hypothetical protein
VENLKHIVLKDLYLETCCQNKYLTRREYVEEEMKKEAIYSKKEVRARNF